MKISSDQPRSRLAALAPLGALAALAPLLLVALAGCGGGGGGDDPDRDPLSGTRWRVQAIGSGGQFADCPTAAYDQDGGFFFCGGDDRVAFGRDGSLVIDFTDEFSDFSLGRGQFRGRWNRDGQTVTGTITQFGFDGDGSGVVDEDELETLGPAQTETAQIQIESDRRAVLIREGDERYVLDRL